MISLHPDHLTVLLAFVSLFIAMAIRPRAGEYANATFMGHGWVARLNGVPALFILIFLTLVIAVTYLRSN